jgi:hypothetical protein
MPGSGPAGCWVAGQLARTGIRDSAGLRPRYRAGQDRGHCTNLNVYGPEDLEHVAQELNGRPRKALDWDTPAERLRDLLTT